jgi:hypothetical protein
VTFRGSGGGDGLIETDVGEHEQAFAQRISSDAPEYELAHWATSNLAGALHAAGQLPPPTEEPEFSLRRAVLVSSARVFRLARAGMAVVAAGYEAESRVFDRSLLETRARRVQVLADPSGGLAKKWLAGALEKKLGAALRDSFPGEDQRMRELYRDLSGDVHPDLRQFMTSLVREKAGGSPEMGFSPHRTAGCRRSLFLYAWLPAEATSEVGIRTNTSLPHHAEFERRVMLAGERLRQELGPAR